MNTQIDSKRFFIKTLGCKVNQYESQGMRELLLKAGFKECLSKETADIYIINTCTVTQKADSESRYWAAQFYRANPKGRIVLTGCAVEKDADRFSFLPGVSGIVKNDDKIRIAEILGLHRPGGVAEGDMTPGRCTLILSAQIRIYQHGRAMNLSKKFDRIFCEWFMVPREGVEPSYP